MTDLPAPPLVEKTVMSRPTSPLVAPSRADGAGARPWPTRATASTSTVASGLASTSRTPARRAPCRTSVESSSTTRMMPVSGRARASRSTGPSASIDREGRAEHDDGRGAEREPGCLEARLTTEAQSSRRLDWRAELRSAQSGLRVLSGSSPR